MSLRQAFTRTAIAALALLGAAGGANLAPAQAQTPEAGPVLLSEVGYGGQYRPGHRTVVRVKVQPTRLIDGRLTLTTPNGRVARNVEVAGGSVKEFVFVVPTDQHSGSLSVEVELRRGKEVVNRHRSSANADGDQEVVGLLPGAAGSGPVPAAAPLSIDMGTVRFARITPAELALAPGSLEGLGIIAAAEGELAGLDRDAAAAIAGWVGKGGRLLVDEAPGAAVPGFAGRPDLATGPNGRVQVGAGEVVSVNGAVAAGRWAGVVEPSDKVVSEAMGMFGSVSEVVAREANIRQAGLGGLIGFLVVYVAVVGPLLFLVLSRSNRRHLAWVAIPGIAVVFTLGAYVIGRNLRSGARPAHATAIVMHGDQAEARTWVGVLSQRGGTAKIRFPQEWTVSESSSRWRGGPIGTDVLEEGSGVAASVPLGAGEFGLLAGTGPVQLNGRLDVTGTVERDGTAKGTVVNRLPFALERIAVNVGDGSTLIQRLEPGATAEWSVTARRVFGRSAHPAIEAWGQSGFSGPPDQFFGGDGGMWQVGGEGSVLLGAMTLGDIGASPTTVTAMGWTRDYRPPVRAGKGLVGNTLVTSIGTLTLPADGPPGDMTTAYTALRGRQVDGMPGSTSIVADSGAVYLRLRPLNPAIDPNKTKLHVHGVSGSVEVWAGGKWTALNIPAEALEGAGGRGFVRPVPRMPMPMPPPCPPGAVCEGGAAEGIIIDGVAPQVPHGPGQGEEENDPTMVALPPGSLVNGNVYLRITNAFGPIRGHELEVLPL